MEQPPGSLAIQYERSYPLIVVGGGLAGTFAAIAAARQGVKVALIQDRPVLGGNSSSEVRVHPVGASQHGYNRDARETGLIEELFLAVRARSYGLRQINGQHYPMWDVVLGELAEAEPNLHLFLNTRVVGVETSPASVDGYESRIDALLAVQMSTEETFRLRGTAIVDATGDGTIALPAGAPFRYGREARTEFDERSAPDEPDDLVLGSTIMFAARDIGRPVPFVPPAWAHVFPDEESLPYRGHDQFESGYWWIEWGGRLNTISDNEAIRRELHAAIFGIWDHIKNRCQNPGVRERAATWALDWIGHLPGKRESRRFEGDYILTERDILAGLSAVPTDVVAYGGWPIDLHAPDGVYSPDRPCHNPPLPGLYGIPLRCLYSRMVANLFLAGRDISASHVGHGSIRVMKTCAAVGEASGTAAALAVQMELTPRALAAETRHVDRLQQILLRNGAYLPRLKNRDPLDLARRPGVVATATSEARLQLDEDDQTNRSGWEHAGMSTLESHSTQAWSAAYGAGAGVAATTALAQAIVLSAERVDALTLLLRSQASVPRVVTVQLRQASHLRDFGPGECADRTVATIESVVEPGESVVTFPLAQPLPVQPGHPIVVVLPATPDLAWCVSAQEPPGTQAGRWDDDLGYWRWLHGTLSIAVEPISRPYGAANVLNGVTRPEVGANLWISDPSQPLPQSLQLGWPEPVTIGRVELTFDSSLSGWIWEGTFPSVVRDYRIEIGETVDGPWRLAVASEGNYQRRRVHEFPAQRGQALRVTVTATNGVPTARIVEVRAYGPT